MLTFVLAMAIPTPDPARSFDIEGLEPHAAHVFGELRRAMQLHRQLMLRAAGERNTPPSQARCLQIVATHDGSTQREIGDLLHLSAPTVTAILKRMERAGTIVREPDPDDQRITRVSITPSGLQLGRELRALLASRIGWVLDSMPEADRDHLARLLGELADRMAAALDEPTRAAPGDSEPAAATATAR